MSRFKNLIGTCKDFAKVVAFETRDATAEGLFKVAEKIDLTDEQRDWTDTKKTEWKTKVEHIKMPFSKETADIKDAEFATN